MHTKSRRRELNTQRGERYRVAFRGSGSNSVVAESWRKKENCSERKTSMVRRKEELTTGSMRFQE